MITVGEILCLPELNNAIVRAGKSGLIRKIRWVHVIDTDDVGLFLEGGEFLLTSGQMWPKSKEMEERLLKSFLRHQISGILFATGRYLSECPESVLEFGEKNGIPVIKIPFHVPFVKITQAIHQEIMKRQYKKIEMTARVPFELLEKLQTVNDYSAICNILADHMKCAVVITNTDQEIIAKADATEGKRLSIQKSVNGLLIYSEKINKQGEGNKAVSILTDSPPYATAVPMFAGGMYWGTMWLISTERNLIEKQNHVLEYSASLVTEQIINNQDLEAKRRQLRIELLELLIENRETASVIIDEKLRAFGLEKQSNWLAGLILLSENTMNPILSNEMESWRDECTDWIIETEGISGFCEIYGGQLVLVISSNLDNVHLKSQFNQLQNILGSTENQSAPVLVLGEIKRDVLSFGESYQEAKALAPIVQYQSHSGGTYFSDQLRRERILYGGLSPEKAVEFRNIILPKELLSNKESTLYQTLKALAAENYNRDAVAKKLHIHLNTLRYRIKRIEELLEDSLTSPRCQFWIQVALDLESLATEYKHEIS